MGGLALVVLIVALTFIVRRRRHRHQKVPTSEETAREKAEMDASVAALPQSRVWEMGGQYDRPEVCAPAQQAHELDT